MKNKNILLTGGAGFIGSHVIRRFVNKYPEYHIYNLDALTYAGNLENLKDIESKVNYTFLHGDITDEDYINSIFKQYQFEDVIHLAAESEPELADTVNHLAVVNMAKIAKANGIKLIHISTDYVFDGANYKPYVETDIPNPQSVYGKTKLEGERAIQEINPLNSIIIRTSWVYSSYGNSFVKTMLRLGKERDELNVVADQIGTPTYTGDLAQAILTILPQINNKQVEYYHYSNEGVCSWYDFAKVIFETKRIKVNVNPIESAHYPTLAERPFYSVLNKRKMKEVYQIEIPFWRDSLNTCLDLISVN